MATKDSAQKKEWASKKKKDIKIVSGLFYVTTTENNTLINLTDENWNKVAWGWTWLLGYKWSKKSTPYAAEVLTKQILKEWQGFGLKEIGIIFKGIWLARDGVFKAINEVWLIDIKYIKEITPIQFGWVKWVRPKKI